MTELNMKEVEEVSGGGWMWENYSDAMKIHEDLVDRLSWWAAKTWP
ncbi:hypothetical protein [Massilia sp. TWR1-2-2]